MNPDLKQLAARLKKAGVKWAFGVSGSGPTLELITELEDAGVSYVCAAHEAAAAVMAGAVARATGDLSVSISIKGPGLANMIGGIAANYFENAPVLSISEAFGAGVPASKNHKRLDQRLLVEAVVKGRITLDNAEGELDRLLTHAKKEIPGPVHLDLCDGGETGKFDEKKFTALTFDTVEVFQNGLRGSKKPVLIVGSLANRRAWSSELSKLSIPVFTTVSAKGVMDESAPFNAGVFTGAGKALAPETDILKAADAIIAVGVRSNELLDVKHFGKPFFLMDEAATAFHLGFSHTGFIDISRPEVVEAVFKSLRTYTWGKEEILNAKSKMKSRLLENPWLPARVFEALNDVRSDHALVLDTGSFCTIGEHIWNSAPHRPFLGSSHGRFMGTGIPTAIGLSLAKPGVPVFCALGDGGFRMHTAEIKLAVERLLPICFILMMDGLYGSIACVPQKRKMSSAAVTIVQPSWYAAIQGLGCPATAVSSDSEFRKAVDKWERKSPLFIEAAFDPVPYAAMTAELR